MAHVLVVDDEAAISQLLECYLAACGHEVTSSRSSLGSLGWLDSTSFDVVVLDVVLPGPMNGLEVCRTLKSDSRMAATAVLVISAIPYAEHDAYDAGADAFIPKPFSLDAIRESVVGLAQRGPTNKPARSGTTVRGAIEAYPVESAQEAEPRLSPTGSLIYSGSSSVVVH